MGGCGLGEETEEGREEGRGGLALTHPPLPPAGTSCPSQPEHIPGWALISLAGSQPGPALMGTKVSLYDLVSQEQAGRSAGQHYCS